jgi:thymidylate kinase
MSAAESHSKPILISFSGIDGAGKSTQIELLCARLLSSNFRVKHLAFWDDVAVLKGYRDTASHTLFGSERGIGAPGKPVERRDKNVQSWYMTAMRFGLYFLDAISLSVVTARASREPADVIVFDRYAYDELANLSSRNFFVRLYVKFLLAIVPKPDVAYILDADPEQARERKPEYPVDFLQVCRSSYTGLSKIGGLTLIAPGSVEEVANQILREFRKVSTGIDRDVRPSEELGRSTL